MIGLGTIVNTAMILAGGTAGLILKKLLPRRTADTIMQGLGLAVIFIGISGAVVSVSTVSLGKISTQYTLITVISLALGGFAGEIIGIEKRLDSFAGKCEKRFSGAGGTFAEGFITATLVFCVGSMAILGALNDGISGNTDILFVKSALDGVSAMIFASAMGFGVLFSALVVFVYQGLITLLALFISPYMNEQIIAQISAVGSLLIIGIGLNMLKITKLKVGNLLPGIFVPVIYNIIIFFIQF